tara:strand:- start:4305 stop:4589 length:285 start_codon:yes stop_codon:yes gene_type:complete
MVNPKRKNPKRRKKRPALGGPLLERRHRIRVDRKKEEKDLRNRVTIKTLQKSGRFVATIDPVTGKVLKRERNPRYVAEDPEFTKLMRKQRKKVA